MSPTEDDTEDSEVLAEVDKAENTDTPVDVTVDDNSSEDPYTAAIEAAIQERLTLEVERIRQEVETQVGARHRETERQAAVEAEARRYRDSWGVAVKEAHSAWKDLKVFDEDGHPAQLGDEVFQSAIATPFQKHNSVVQQGVSQQLLNELADEAFNSLPKEAQESFITKATGKPLGEWLRAYAESLAPHTDYATLTAKEVSAKLRAAEARGVAKGQRLPLVTPAPTSERQVASNKFDMKTQYGLAQALSQNLITTEEYVEKRKLLDQSG